MLYSTAVICVQLNARQKQCLPSKPINYVRLLLSNGIKTTNGKNKKILTERNTGNTGLARRLNLNIFISLLPLLYQSIEFS